MDGCISIHQGDYQFISDWTIKLDNYIYSIDILDEDNLLLRYVGEDDKKDLFQIRMDSLNKN